MRPAFLDALRIALDRLEDCGIHSMVTGAVALQAYGTPRQTWDADIALTFRDARQRQCFEKGLILEDEGRDMFGQPTLIYHPALNPALIEVFLASEPYPLRALGRRRSVRLEVIDRTAWVIAPEDLVVMKALQHRQPDRMPAKAAQDLVDIAGIFATKGEALDLGLIRREAGEMGVLPVLREWLPP